MPLLLGDLLRRNAAAVPRRPAAVLGAASLTHLELERASSRLAHAIRGLGLGRGDRLLCWSRTRLDLLPLFAACAKIGAIFAPAGERLGTGEVTELAALARPALIVADAPRAEAAASLARAAGVSRLARIGGSAGPGVSLEERASRASDSPPDAPDLLETDPHVVFFTSGSTGRPKGVMLSQRTSRLRAMLPAGSPRTLSAFPLSHMAGYAMALGAWTVGGTIWLVERAEGELLRRELERGAIQRLYCIPAVWRRVLASSPRPERTGSLRFADTGTSATPPDLLAAIREAFPQAATRVFYGSTEAGLAALLAEDDVERKPGSVGLPAPGAELRLAEDGELLVSTDALMEGYLGDPEASARALADGWYRSGDLASFDDEGYVTIVGRKREVIRSGGETVAPAEVEAALEGAPGVRELAVIGLPDERWGEVVCAVVVPEPGAHVSLDRLRAYVRGRIAAHKEPRALELVAEIPRTHATGQIQRRLLAERVQAARAPAVPEGGGR